MKIMAVIPARAGSKGIPGKNYRYLYNRPLIEHSIISAMESKGLDYIVISSNCERVEQIAKRFMTYDSRVIFVRRPEKLCQDNSSTEACLEHSYYHMKNKLGFISDAIMLLQPTSPIRNKGLVDNAIKQFDLSEADSMVSVSEHTPFFFKKDSVTKFIRPVSPAPGSMFFPRPMRQELTEEQIFYHDNGNLYITKIDILLQDKSRIGGKIVLLEQDKMQSLQIDDEIDFMLCERALVFINKMPD